MFVEYFAGTYFACRTLYDNVREIENHFTMTELCQGTGDTCGWAAALISTLAFGSFAVPIKSPTCAPTCAPTCVQLQIDPMFFQTYKTFMCLITSFALILLLDPPHKNDPTYTNPNLVFSPWGIVSGLFWVPGGVAAVYAVQNAGLAVSQGVWSSNQIQINGVFVIFQFFRM